MKNLANDIKLLKSAKESLRGVFDDSDLSNLFSDLHKTQLYRRIKSLTENGYLTRFCRGMYVTEGFDLEVVSQKLSESSYISFGTILAEHLAIGSIPKFQVEAVKSGKTRTYSFDKFKIKQYGTKTSLDFGITRVNGVRKADLERAILDCLYFHLHGTKFYFDIYSDINWDKVDKKKLNTYLTSHYKNKKFISFVKGIVE